MVTSFFLPPDQGHLLTNILISFLTKVTGIDLAKEVSKEVVELIKQDVRYKIAQILLLELLLSCF